MNNNTNNKIEGAKRREIMLETIKNAPNPISGSALAKQFGVSRQVVVQDIALLRANDNRILSTARGYLYLQKDVISYERCFSVIHDQTRIEEELNLVVDLGASVQDVIIDHPIYGEIRCGLKISSRRDVKDFLSKIKTHEGTPLLAISRGVHSHTITADSLIILDEVEEALSAASFLYQK